jgi:hypothetical protein
MCTVQIVILNLTYKTFMEYPEFFITPSLASFLIIKVII